MDGHPINRLFVGVSDIHDRRCRKAHWQFDDKRGHLVVWRRVYVRDLTYTPLRSVFNLVVLRELPRRGMIGVAVTPRNRDSKVVFTVSCLPKQGRTHRRSCSPGAKQGEMYWKCNLAYGLRQY